MPEPFQLVQRHEPDSYPARCLHSRQSTLSSCSRSRMSSFSASASLSRTAKPLPVKRSSRVEKVSISAMFMAGLLGQHHRSGSDVGSFAAPESPSFFGIGCKVDPAKPAENVFAGFAGSITVTRLFFSVLRANSCHHPLHQRIDGVAVAGPAPAFLFSRKSRIFAQPVIFHQQVSGLAHSL